MKIHLKFCFKETLILASRARQYSSEIRKLFSLHARVQKDYFVRWKNLCWSFDFIVLHSIFNRFKRDTFQFNLSSFQDREIIMWFGPWNVNLALIQSLIKVHHYQNMLNTLRYKIVVHTRLFILPLFLQFCIGHLHVYC